MNPLLLVITAIPVSVSIYFSALLTNPDSNSQKYLENLVQNGAFNPTPTPTPSPTPAPSPTPSPSPTPNPSPTPSPTPTAYSGSDLDGWFEKYAREYGIDRMLLFKIAVCESGLRANAVNGPYGGVFQFTAGSWISTRTTMNLDPNPDLRFNPEEAIRTAAFKISVSGTGAWPNCGK